MSENGTSHKQHTQKKECEQIAPSTKVKAFVLRCLDFMHSQGVTTLLHLIIKVQFDLCYYLREVKMQKKLFSVLKGPLLREVQVQTTFTAISRKKITSFDEARLDFFLKNASQTKITMF